MGGEIIFFRHPILLFLTGIFGVRKTQLIATPDDLTIPVWHWDYSTKCSVNNTSLP
jgi:hypothetical protein